MASRKLIVEIIGDSRSLERSFARSTQASRKFSVGLGTILKGAVVFGAVTRGMDLLGSAIRTGAAEFSEGAKAAAQTNAVIKSTGGIANVTARHVDALASSIQGLSGIDDEAIKSGQNLLLTFKNVRNEIGRGNAIFDRATRSAVDLSVAGFGSLETTSKQLGKALNDPVRGMTALSRAGVTFSDAQKKVIKNLVATGRTLEAQKLILAEVESQVGGSAKALGDTLPGQLNKLRESFKNTMGDLAASVAPVLTRALSGFNDFVADLGRARTVSAKFRVVATGLENIGRDLLRQAQDAIRRIDWNQVGEAVGRFLSTSFNRTAAFLQATDWSRVGRAIVRGIGDFLRGVNWRAVAVGTIKLLVAALKATASLLIGIGKELGAQLMGAIGAGLDAAKDFVLRKLLEFVNKVLGITGFLGRFDPFKGTRERVQASLRAMERDTTRSVQNIQRSLNSIQDPDVRINIRTVIQGAANAAAAVSANAQKITGGVEDALAGFRKAARAALDAGRTQAQGTQNLTRLKRETDRQADAAADVVKSQKKVAKTAEEIAAARQETARKLREALTARQFRAIGLSATGDEIIPGLKNLRRQFATLSESVIGQDVPRKLLNRLAAVGKFLATGVKNVAPEVRSAINDLFRTIRDEFDRGADDLASGSLTKTTALNASKILGNITGLTRDQERQLRANLSSFNSAGLALARPSGNLGGIGAGIGIVPVVESHISVELQGEPLAKYVTRSQVKTSRGTRQKRGPNRRSGI